MSALTTSPTGLIFTSVGSKPLRQARISPAKRTTAGAGVKRVYCKDVKGYGVELKGPRTTRLELPPRKRDSLGVTHRYLVFQVKVPAGRDFAVELTVSDTNHFRYRLILSTAIKAGSQRSAEAAANAVRAKKRNPGNPLHFQLPLRMTKNKWTNVVVDVMQLTQDTFGAPTLFRCCDNVAITANCQLRNIFSALENPVALPSAVPAHLALRMANGSQPCTVFVGGVDQDDELCEARMTPKFGNGELSARSTRSHSIAAITRLPLPSPVPTIAHAPGAASAAAMVSPSLPTPPPSVRLAFGTRVSPDPNLVDSGNRPTPARTNKKASRRRPKKGASALPSRMPSQEDNGYWDELPRRRFPKSTDENGEFVDALVSPNETRGKPVVLGEYGEGSPLSPPCHVTVKDAMLSPSLGSDRNAEAAEAQAEHGLAQRDAAFTPDRREEEEQEERFSAAEHEPEATPPRDYDVEDQCWDGADAPPAEEVFDETGSDERDLRATMGDLRETESAEHDALAESQQGEQLNEEDEPPSYSSNDVDEDEPFLCQNDQVVHDGGNEGDSEEVAYADDDDAENDEEAEARIAYLYSQLELKRRQIAQMEAEFSDADMDGQENTNTPRYYEAADDGREGAGLPLDDSVRVGDVSEDVVNLGRMKEDELAGFASAEDDMEEDEELIFDPILDCYYSPRTNTYFERQ